LNVAGAILAALPAEIHREEFDFQEVCVQISAMRQPFRIEVESDGGADFEREPFPARARRMALGLAFDLKPPRHRVLPALGWRLGRHLASGRAARARLPLPQDALPVREGVAGFCSDMSVATLRSAYAQGLYPCTHVGPVRWNAPPMRAVLDIDAFKLRDELRRKLKKRIFRITFDRAPMAVMKGCAAPRPGQWPLTWITPDVMRAYHALYEAGDMHTVEVWDADSRLVGGIFGTVVGRCFVLESLFHTRDNSSKYGLAVLVAHLQAWGFTHVDNKLQNPHTEALGFREIERVDYVALLREPTPEAFAHRHWIFDETLDLGRWTPEKGAPVRIAPER